MMIGRSASLSPCHHLHCKSLCAWFDSCLCKYSHISRDHNRSQVVTVLQFRFQAKAAYHAKGSSLHYLKSLSKSTFDFSDPTQACLLLAGFSNMISLKISLRGFNIKACALLAGSVNMRFLFLPIPWISKSLILVTNWKVSIPWRRKNFLAHCNH